MAWSDEYKKFAPGESEFRKYEGIDPQVEKELIHRIKYNWDELERIAGSDFTPPPVEKEVNIPQLGTTLMEYAMTEVDDLGEAFSSDNFNVFNSSEDTETCMEFAGMKVLANGFD